MPAKRVAARCRACGELVWVPSYKREDAECKPCAAARFKAWRLAWESAKAEKARENPGSTGWGEKP